MCVCLDLYILVAFLHGKLFYILNIKNEHFHIYISPSLKALDDDTNEFVKSTE
jgi:hypothetical protein